MRVREWTHLISCWGTSFASLPSMLSRDKVNKQCRVEGQSSLTLKTKQHPHQTPCLRNKENKPAAGPGSTDIRALLSSILTTKRTLQEPKNATSVIYFPQTRKQLFTFFSQRKSNNTCILNSDYSCIECVCAHVWDNRIRVNSVSSLPSQIKLWDHWKSLRIWHCCISQIVCFLRFKYSYDIQIK